VKEELLVRGRGCLEQSILLVSAPQATISEGIATLAPDMLGEDLHELAAMLLRPLGVPYDVRVARAVREHSDTLASIGDNAAILLHEQGRPLDEVREYWRRWTLRTDDQVDKGIEFVTDETWRAYGFCYTAGLRLARSFVQGDPARFRRLLTEQLVPSDLAERA
jgi:hypothetical protein